MSTCLSLNDAIAPSRAGQDGEGHQGSVSPLDLGDRRHRLNDVTNLLQRRDARWAGRLGDTRFLGRKVEVLGVRIGNTGLIAGLPGEPDEETLQGGQRGIQCCLAQWLTATLTALVGKVALESLGLLDMESLEVFVPGIDFEARDRLRDGINSLLAVGVVIDWVSYLRREKLWSLDDPLFPATRVAAGADLRFVAAGLDRKHWSGTSPIRQIFKEAFAAAGLPYFNPHSFRKTLALLGGRLCKTPEEYKAWSQNLGHDHVLTTFSSYGDVGSYRQAEIIRALSARGAPPRQAT
jgi:hypothetical protein